MFGASFSLRLVVLPFLAMHFLLSSLQLIRRWPETEVQGLDPDLALQSRVHEVQLAFEASESTQKVNARSSRSHLWFGKIYPGKILVTDLDRCPSPAGLILFVNHGAFLLDSPYTRRIAANTAKRNSCHDHKSDGICNTFIFAGHYSSTDLVSVQSTLQSLHTKKMFSSVILSEDIQNLQKMWIPHHNHFINLNNLTDMHHSENL